MPSINLLPENFTIEAYKKREKLAVYALAVFFLCGTTAVSVWAARNEQTAENESADLDQRVAQAEQAIKRSVEDSELMSSQYNKADIEKLLKEHVYFSKGIELIRSLILVGAYLEGADFGVDDNGNYAINLELVAQNYDVLLKQFGVMQDSFWIEGFAPGEMKMEPGAGVSCPAKLTLRKDLFAFQEQYWDFGMDVLAGGVNRYIDIDSYSVSLKKETAKGAGAASETVTVKFSGAAYDSAKLDAFEKYLNGQTEILKEPVKLNRLNAADSKPGVTNFTGTIVLNH